MDDPRAVALGEDVSFGADMGELILFEHFLLEQCLHRVDLARVHLLREADLAERAFANDLDRPKVFKSDASAAQTEVVALASPERLELSRLEVIRREDVGVERLFQRGSPVVS